MLGTAMTTNSKALGYWEFSPSKCELARPSFYRVGQSYSWDAGVASLPELLSRSR